jgi:hypothetical protein
MRAGALAASGAVRGSYQKTMSSAHRHLASATARRALWREAKGADATARRLREHYQYVGLILSQS